MLKIEENKVTILANVAKLAEATVYGAVKIDTTAFTADVDVMTIAAFSETPFSDGKIKAVSSTNNFPGFGYNAAGDLDEVSGDAGFTGVFRAGINLSDKNSFARCEPALGTSCYLLVSFTYVENNFILCKDPIKYTFGSISVSAVKNAYVTESVPQFIDISLPVG